MPLRIDDIAQLFRDKGDEQYSGEPVTQLEHALQSAQLAEQAGASAALITAAFLHDLGHLLHDLGETPTLRGLDDVHQYRALPFLRGLFDDEVLNPIKLHVDAKRYLCAVRPGYFGSLSADSVRSLALQGGIYSEADANAFMAQAGAADATRLREWDDLAKSDGLATPSLEHYLAIAQSCALR